MTLNIFDSRDEAIAVLARYFVQTARDAIEEEGRCSVALSGGNSPRALYELLAGQFGDKLDWNRLHFFFGDERCVPHTDTASNFRMAQETLFGPLHIPDDHIFAVDTTLEPSAAAKAYERTVFDFFRNETPRFDIMLLGMGDNAHTASLFPGTDILKAARPGVEPVWVPEKQAWRISFNAPLINDARHIAFLVFGQDKATAMQHVFSETPEPDLYPVQLIRKDHTAWFTDRAATALLPS